jgi:hypothetical protein
MLLIPVIMGAGAMAIDLGFVFMCQAQEQVVADAAALAAASGINVDIDTARARGRAVAAKHTVGGRVPDLDEEDIIFGTYESGVFKELPDDEFIDANAAKVDVQDSWSPMLGKLFMKTGMLSPWADAIAVMPAGGPTGSVDCFLPLALPDCAFDLDATKNPDPIHLTFGNNLQDNAAWAHPQIVNTPNVIDQFAGNCTGGEISVGDDLPLGNGVNTPLINKVADMINGDDSGSDAWPTDNFPGGPPSPRDETNYAFEYTSDNNADSLVTAARWGFVVAGPIAIVDMKGEPGTCLGIDNFNQSHEIVGFTYAFLYDARKGNAHNKGFMLQLDYVNDYDLGGNSDPDAIGNIIGDDPPVLVN